MSSQPSRSLIHPENPPGSSIREPNISISDPPAHELHSTGKPSHSRPPPPPVPPSSPTSASLAVSRRPSSSSIDINTGKRSNDPRRALISGQRIAVLGRRNIPQTSASNINTNHRRPTGLRSTSVHHANERPLVTSPPQIEFNGLVRSILEHPSFPLVFSGTYEASTGISPVVTDNRTQKSLAEAKVNFEQLEGYTRHVGLSRASEKSNSLDIFMCGIVSALRELNNPRPPSIPAPLHDTIRACGSQPKSPEVIRTPIYSNRSSHAIGNTHSSGSGSTSGSPDASNVPIFTHTPTRPKLDESAKKYLENWFDSHFDNPYPTDVEKKKISKECNLQLNQINNWFGKFSLFTSYRDIC